MSADQWRFIDIVRTQTDAGPSEAQDTVAIESPLQVLVNGQETQTKDFTVNR